MHAGQFKSLIALACAMLAFAAAAGNPRPAGAQDAEETAAVEEFATDPARAVPACASDPGKLGLERIVEIDTSSGTVFGGAGHAQNNFLQDREVVLTFDDGPMRAYTRKVLKALDEHCTRATFFMVGRMAAADPAMVKEVLAQGHTVGSHTYAHQNLRPLGFIKGRADFEQGLSAVTKAAGAPIAPFFRFPYLAQSRQIADYIAKRGTSSFFIDIDSKDFQTRNGDAVYQRVMGQLMTLKKGIILMHDIQPSTAGMIKRLLDTLHDKGFKVVHMVPKQGASTVAEFDGPAAKAMAAKNGKLKDQPLADRTLVWTMAPGKGGDAAKAPPSRRTETGTLAPVKAAAPAAVSQAAGAKGEDLPWSAQVAPPAKVPAPQAARRTPRRQEEELPWQARVFSN